MNKKTKSRWGLTVSLVLFIFAILLAAILMAGLLILILHVTGALPLWEGPRPEQASGGALHGIIVLMGFSIFIGTAIAAFFSKKALNPIRKVVDATNKVAGGDFDVRVDIRGIYELEELSSSFNKMTHELSSVESLRREFINNFSHELKTPNVSIRGFAKLLKDGQLSDEEKHEYLEIIITESERLSELATNILNLSKYEAIDIVTDKAPFRLDEQIRRAIAITEPKWSAKDLSINIGMDEINFSGNENLTQQIWINLLENAIKFTRRSGNIGISLMDGDETIYFSISDDGIGMAAETQYHIFEKFYQGDRSHKNMGNGLGLTIVKRIVELCGGTIGVESDLGKGSVFTVTLPKQA